MSRTRKAAVNAVFGYSQFAIAIASGIVLVPLTLHRVGATSYGLWLASGEILGHAGMVELGVLSVMPWLIAEADGKADRARMRRLVGNGVAVATFVGALYLALAIAGWMFLPGFLRLSQAERASIYGPLAILVVANAVGYPLRVFSAVVSGLQDVYFNGVLTLITTAASVSITAVLIVKGYLLYALAIGATLPSTAALLAELYRVYVIAPDLLTGWTRPHFADIRPLFKNGAGVWLGTMGWSLLSATNGIVITYLGHPEWVAVYAVMSKLSTMATQVSWILPDSGLVGLAQLYGEHRDRGRLRSVALMMLRLHLLLAGAAACGVLAFNPAFVTRWVGGGFFAGLQLNALLAAAIICSSLIHGLIATASVLGNRLRVGSIALVNGVVQAVLSLLFGHWWGLTGIASAGILAGLMTAIPAGIMLLKPSTALTFRDLAAELLWPWGYRIAPIAAAAAIVGFFYHAGIVASAALTEVVLLWYAWQMRALYARLPLDPRITVWLSRIGLMTPEPAAAASASASIAGPASAGVAAAGAAAAEQL
jgi:O-antigen/teichoic acid export membrane protein